MRKAQGQGLWHHFPHPMSTLTQCPREWREREEREREREKREEKREREREGERERERERDKENGKEAQSKSTSFVIVVMFSCLGETAACVCVQSDTSSFLSQALPGQLPGQLATCS